MALLGGICQSPDLLSPAFRLAVGLSILSMGIYTPKSNTLTTIWNPPPLTRARALPIFASQ